MKINDHTLITKAQTGELEGVRLRVVDEGMKCELVAQVSGNPDPLTLTAKRGGPRVMHADTALRYVKEALGQSSVKVELEK